MIRLNDAVRRIVGPVGHRLRSAEHLARNVFGISETEAKLLRDSQHYWGEPRTDQQQFNSHWRGHGAFAGDDERWLAVGREHLALYWQFARALELPVRPARVIEWGCGGGANAVHFAPLTDEFVGVDIAQPTLDECGRQLAAAGWNHFAPVLADAARPEAACPEFFGACDVFLCTYVFEALPSPEYAHRILVLARNLLRAGGLAMIQIKYRTGHWRTAPRHWGYVRNLAHNTTYSIDEFWLEAESCGLKPRLISLVPKQPLVNDERYAYFALQK